MRFICAGSMCFAAVTAFGMAGFAQQLGSPDAQQVTIVGCVQREADYRRARDAGKGGAAGTGIGVGNEFVLINASMATGAAAPGAAGQPTGTSGVSTAMSAYELTGPNEGQLASHVGKRV